MTSKKEKVVVVGGGPVGCLSAILLGRRGYKVDLYEARPDIRKKEESMATGRSINLALSHRGISALKRAGLDKAITEIGTPAPSRYIHASNGTHYVVPYGKKGQFLLSIDRLELNRRLLTAAERGKNINIHFGHKLNRCDTKAPSATFISAGGSTTTVTDASVVFGCDGAHSAVRMNMLRRRMNFSQTYIEHGYKELLIPATANGEYAMPPNYLHIWPRHEFMLIALPNLDKTFTCTLFMPFAIFEKITTGDDVIKFFEKYFVDAIPLIGEEFLKESFLELPPFPMVTVRCKPYNDGGTAVLLGDAAHAVVPFYGQGLNCGLEDTLVFDDIMEELNCDFSRVLPRFSEIRMEAGHAIADLSLYNYKEMRSHVATFWFLLRKKVDGVLNFLLPNTFVPRYSMVAFTRIPYNEVIERARKQDKIVDTSLVVTGCLASAFAAFNLYHIINSGEMYDFGLLQYIRLMMMESSF